MTGEHGLQASTLKCISHGNLVILVDMLMALEAITMAYTFQLLGNASLSGDVGCSLDLISISSFLSVQTRQVSIAYSNGMGALQWSS